MQWTIQTQSINDSVFPFLKLYIPSIWGIYKEGLVYKKGIN